MDRKSVVDDGEFAKRIDDYGKLIVTVRNVTSSTNI